MERDCEEPGHRRALGGVLVLLVVAGWAVATRDNGQPQPTTYWVAPDGHDNAPGTPSDPWATFQKAADSAAPGATVYVREEYAQRVDLHVSGAPGSPITFEPAPGEAVVLNGSSLDVPAGQSAMIGDRLPALRHDPRVRYHGLPQQRVGPRADRDPRDRLGRPRAARRQHGARPRNDLRRTQRRRRARDRRVRHDGRSPDRRRRDRRQRARQPHARLLRGAGRERERHGLPDPGEPRARHEQHRDRS